MSSTSYDLIDVRAEVESCLKDAGIVPVMSDRSQTDFRTVPDCNSIERCLVNLESCDSAIFILSQRYGPSLKGAGYDDVSATHLEYIHAREKELPIHFYARDRLEADYRTWRKNGRVESVILPWLRLIVRALAV